MHRKIYFPFAERSSETPPLRWGKITNSKLSPFVAKIRHLGDVYGLSSLLREENYAKPNPTEIKKWLPDDKSHDNHFNLVLYNKRDFYHKGIFTPT